MGGRSGPSTRTITGGSGGASTRRIKTRLDKASSKIAAEVVFEVMASTNPSIAALYLAYKVTKFVKPIVEEGAKEYRRTGDVDKATEKMAKETVKQTGKEIVKESIGVVVNETYVQTVQNTGVERNPVVDKVVTSTASKVIEEIVVGD